jgi:DNA polymerase-3 subunit delta'
LALSESVARRGAEDAFGLALETVSRWASGRLESKAPSGPARLAPLVEVCENIARAAVDVDTYNLDRRPLVLSMFGELAEAVRRTEAQPDPV